MGPVNDIKSGGGISLAGGTYPRPFDVGGTATADKWSGMSANTPQPQLLAARVQLRREMIDLSFRSDIIDDLIDHLPIRDLATTRVLYLFDILTAIMYHRLETLSPKP